MNLLKRPSLYLALLGLAALALLLARLQAADPPALPLEEPASTPYAQPIGGRGIVESLDENVRIAPAVAGRVSDLFVGVGDRVKAGDPLFQVDPRAAQAEVALRQSEVALTEARIRQAEVTVADRLDKLTRTRTLAARRAVSEDEAIRDDFAHQSAVTALETAKADLALAQSRLHAAQVNLDLHLTTAPRDGKILFSDIRVGEYAAADPGDALMLIGDTDRLQLRADVDEESAARVRPGSEAVAFFKGFRSDPIPLQFVRIDPYVLPKRSLTGESTERVDTRVLQVIYQFDLPDTPIYVGQQMDVFINGATD